ncbi:hypothetical protein BGX30_015049 [Mortierella sp. GBA39]|nr:hypothetical protein BGX30_015049 [Mortierella sp. GBA39]
MAGALIFPVGFVIIVLLGLELVTGSFALIPLAVMQKKASVRSMLGNYGWVILGHVIGCLVYAVLYGLTITKMGHDMSSPLVQTIIKTSEAKTLAYKELGGEGLLLVVIKAMLCNWMVTLGVVMAFTSKSTAGKIAAMWLPILIFFGRGFEHAVVNMFVIPAGMMLGAKVSFADWWLWNQIPVLIGNFIGGALFTGVAYYPGMVSIVGAGPGDPELITVKALRRIQKADVILYDRLVNKELLGYAKKGAALLYVGKAPGQHAVPQAEIHEQLAAFALKGKQVVRLKGGDPLIFGRGGEEAQEMALRGIPGSSCAGREQGPRWDLLAQGVDTLVVYMGVAGMADICRELIAHGRPHSSPAAIVEQGTSEQERVITGTVGTIHKLATLMHVKNPALLIFGEVVHVREQLLRLAEEAEERIG